MPGGCFAICNGCNEAETESVIQDIAPEDDYAAHVPATSVCRPQPVLGNQTDETEELKETGVSAAGVGINVAEEGDDYGGTPIHKVKSSGSTEFVEKSSTNASSHSSREVGSVQRTASFMRSLSVRKSTSSAQSQSMTMTRTRSAGTLAHSLKSGNDMTLFDPRVVELLSFEGCEEYLRGSYFCTIMTKAAQIFQNAAGSAHTFEMSTPVKQIHTFVSHNWCIPRWKKFFCLALHFNMEASRIFILVFMVGIAILNMTGVAPVVIVREYKYPMGILGKFLTNPALMIAIFFKHEIHRLIGGPGDVPVFLDKVCIHQTDLDIQKKGIQKLGAYLCNSEHMMVIYTDLYLQKLWTIYEVSCFLCLHPVDKMIVVPTFQPMLYFACANICWVIVWVQTLFFYKGWDYNLWLFSTCIFLSLCAHLVFRRWARDVVAIRDRLATFRVQNCICFCEDDRPFVYGNICLFMKAIEVVDDSSTEEEGLHAFNMMVRGKVATSINYSIGGIGVKFSTIIAVFSGYHAAMFIDVLAGVAYGMSMLEVYSTFLFYGSLSLGAVPFSCAWFAYTPTWCIHLRGAKEWMFLCLLTFGQLVLNLPFVSGMKMLYVMSEDSEIAVQVVGVMSGLFAGVCTVNLLIFNKTRTPPKFSDMTMVKAVSSRVQSIASVMSPGRLSSSSGSKSSSSVEEPGERGTSQRTNGSVLSVGSRMEL